MRNLSIRTQSGLLPPVAGDCGNQQVNVSEHSVVGFSRSEIDDHLCEGHQGENKLCPICENEINHGTGVYFSSG